MTTFHTISIPHNDILQGRLTMDVFAADLWEVYKDAGLKNTATLRFKLPSAGARCMR